MRAMGSNRRMRIGVVRIGAQQRGFTLLEVLIAISMTAIIGIGIWQMLSGVISAKKGVDRVSDEFSRMQQAIVILERDLAQIVFRPVRDEYGQAMPAVTTTTGPWGIEFTRAGWRNPLQNARSDLQRVAYELVNGTLRRHYWQVLDRAQDSQAREQNLLEGVTELSWRFLDHEREWQEQWPSNAQLQSLPINGAAEASLPLAVEVIVDHRRFGRIRRLVDLGTYNPAAVAEANANAGGGLGGSASAGGSSGGQNGGEAGPQ